MQSTWPALNDPIRSMKIVAGRRRYIAKLRALRAERRLVVAQTIAEAAARPDGPPRGWMASLARQLGVNRSTILRDARAVLAEAVAA